MARKKDFKPDKPRSGWLSKLYITPKQRRAILKWVLYSLVVLVLSLLQDVVLCNFRLFGAATEQVPCAIILICQLEGTQNGSVFALAASGFYLFSGSAPGPHVLVLITVLAVVLSALRQTYLHPRFPAMLLCVAFAMVLYELTIFGFCMLLGQVTAVRFNAFLVAAITSLISVPVVYPIAKIIGRIGGEAWKE